jgi:hypothetical protein
LPARDHGRVVALTTVRHIGGEESLKRTIEFARRRPGPDNARLHRRIPLAHPTSLPTSAAQLRQLCAVYAKPHFGRALWQLINTVPLFITLWALMAYGVTHDWNYGWVLLLALPTAGLYAHVHRAARLRPWLVLQVRTCEQHRRRRSG